MPLGRRAAVDRERERPVRVLVEQQLARLDVGERRRVLRVVLLAVDVDDDAAPEPQPGARTARRASTSSVTLPKRSIASACATSSPPSTPRGRQLERARARPGRAGRPASASGAPAGERRRDRREQVAAVERRRHRAQAVRRLADLDRLDDAAELLGGER